MIIDPEGKCPLIMLYGTKPSPGTLELLYSTLKAWFEELGCSIHESSVHGEGFSGKAIRFHSNDRKLKTNGFQKVEAFWLDSLDPEAESHLHDWLVTAGASIEMEYVELGVDPSIVAALDEHLLVLVRSLIELAEPTYGTGLLCPRQYSPVFYGMGICSGIIKPWGETEAESEKMGGWHLALSERQYEAGYIRDVYPWNFLTEPCLSRPVRGMRLDAWIREDSTRGSLTELSRGVHLWRVAEEQRPAVREALDQADVIFDRDRYLAGRETPDEHQKTWADVLKDLLEDDGE